MTLHLRIAMILLALFVMVIIIRSVNSKRMRMQYALVWVVISVMMLAVAVFPVIAEWLCKITGIQTPANLIYLLGIIALLLVSFMQTGIISKQADQISTLTQALSLHQYSEAEDEEGKPANGGE